MKKTKLWIPAHGFVRDSTAQWMSYVIFCHKSVLLFGKLVLSVSFFSDSREGKCPFWVRERECVKAAKSILVFLVKNWEVWKKEQRNFKYVGESKSVKNIRPDYLCITLNLIVYVRNTGRLYCISWMKEYTLVPYIGGISVRYK